MVDEPVDGQAGRAASPVGKPGRASRGDETGRRPEPLEVFVARIASEAGVSTTSAAAAVRSEIKAGRILVDEEGRVLGLSWQARGELDALRDLTP